MKLKALLVTSLFLTLIAFLVVPSFVFAQDDEDDIDDLQEKIEKYEKKLSDLSKREKSLSTEIQTMTDQVSLTELRIANSTAKITKKTEEIIKLAGDITDLKGRIGKLQENIELQQKVLNARLRERYKSGETSPIIIFFGSDTINQLVKKSEYLRVSELQDKKLLAEMDKTKKAFTKQKDLFEDKKIEEEQLKNELMEEKANLDSYKVQLESQKAEKKRLLDVTQNDEAKYQKLLAEAQRELDQITNAVSVLKNTQAKEVKKGERIGTQGNSGYSFGDHLHFGVYRYSSFQDIDGWNWYYSNYVDPLKKLKSKTVYYDTGCESAGDRKVGKGDWGWPLSNPTISQGFGHTCWSNVYYGGKDHPALDMYGAYGSAVYAAEDGDAYFCRNCLGDGGNGVFIFHDDNYMTLYWHLK